MALQNGRLDVESVRQLSAEPGLLAADQHLGPFVGTDLEVGQDLVLLRLAGLRPDHCRHVARIALFDGFHTGYGALDEGLVDVFLDQRARRAGADLALVEGEQHKALDRLVEKGVVLGHHVGKEDVRRLATQFQRHRDQVLGRGLHDLLARHGRAGKGDLGDALRGGQCVPDFGTVAVDDIEHTGRQQITDDLHQHHDRSGGLFRRFEHDTVARCQRRGQLPRSHQDREVPRDDLPDNAQRLVEVIGNRVIVDLRHRAFLTAQNACEIAEMVDRQRNIGGGGLADRLAVVPGFGQRQQIEVCFHHIGDFQQGIGALSGRFASPGHFCGMGGVQRQGNVVGVRAGDRAHHGAGDRGDIVKVAAVDRGREPASDVVVIAFLERRRVGAVNLGHFIHCRSSSGPRSFPGMGRACAENAALSAGGPAEDRARCLSCETGHAMFSFSPRRFMRR